MDKKTKIVVDTNVCHSGNRYCDFREFSLGKKIQTLIMWLDCLELSEKVKIILPEMVIKELEKQKIDQYFEKKNDLLGKIKSNQFPDMQINITMVDEFDYKKYISEIINQVFKKNFYLERVMPFPKYSNRLIERAINKRQPFEGVNANSDKGFKDAVIWESILEYKEIHPQDNIILYSQDNRFGDELISEYKEKFDDDILIFKNENDLLTYLKAMSDVDNVDIDDLINKYLEINDYLKNNIEKIVEMCTSHLLDGAWYECEMVQILSIKQEDLYLNICEEPSDNRGFEASFWVETKLFERQGKYIDFNLNFAVGIDYVNKGNIKLYTIGSTMGHGRI